MAKTETAAIGVTAWTRIETILQGSHMTNGRLSLWKHSWDFAFWVWPWNNSSSDVPVTLCISCLTRNTQKTHSSTLMKFGSCWGAPHVLYLLQNGWMLLILQEIVTSSAICSSKLLTDLHAESIFSMQRINLSKPAYYLGSLSSFFIILTSMQNTTRNILTSQNPQDISGRRTYTMSKIARVHCKL